MKTCERLARARSHHARAAVCTTCLMAPLPPCAPRRAAGAAGAAEAAEAAEEGRGGGAAAGLHLSSCCLPRCCCPLRVRDRTDSLTCTLVSRMPNVRWQRPPSRRCVRKLYRKRARPGMSTGGSPPQEGDPHSSSTGFGPSLGGLADASRLTPLGRQHMPGAQGSTARGSAGTPDHQVAWRQSHQVAGSWPASSAELLRLSSPSPTPRGETPEEEGRRLC